MKTLIDIWKQHVEWRQQLIKLAKADLIKTYSGAALGWAWALVKPMIMIFVFWFAFGIGLRRSSSVEVGGEVFPFILWLLAGLVPWWYISEMITKGASAILKYRYLVTKMKFPVSTIPTFIALSSSAVHVFLVFLVIVIFVISGKYPDIYFLQLPIYLILMVLFSIVWGLFSSMLSAMSKDFLNLVKSLTTAIFWLSGIIWDINKIDTYWLQNLLKFNPVTFFVNGYRNVFVYKVWIWEDMYGLLYFGLVLLLMLSLAVWCYKKLIKEIPDVL